jgi:hypothetical protein
MIFPVCAFISTADLAAILSSAAAIVSGKTNKPKSNTNAPIAGLTLACFINTGSFLMVPCQEPVPEPVGSWLETLVVLKNMHLLRRDVEADDVSLFNSRLSTGSSDQLDTADFNMNESVRA